ncbi:MAG: hypothetical protein QME47_08205, partial [Candidatus Thermoplasmatota archaeon]|nr:hypothetical protein [Candidatus Thermoplasmatota archaeon]
AFDNEDLKEVRLEINGSGYHYTTPPLENITTGDYTYKWNYSGESSRLKAGDYTARLNVITHQHTFYKTINFTFIACALDSWSNRTYETILVGKSASYAVAIRNTGSYDTKVTINISFDIQIIPGGSHLWNITVFDKDRGVIVGNVSTNASRSLYYDVYNFNGGSTKNLILTVTSADTTIGVDWKCRVDLHARSITPDHEANAPPVTIFTYIAAPYEINITWSKRYDYILVNRLYQLELTVINLGSMPDSVEIVLNYTNKAVWNITLEKDIVENLNPYGSPGYLSTVKLNVTADTTAGADNTTLNITAESVYAPLDYKANWTNKTLKYLTLELKRAFGISLPDVGEYTKNVDVKVSQDQAQYTIALETNDEIPHLVR